MDRRPLSVSRPLPIANGSPLLASPGTTARLGAPRADGEHSRFVVESYRHLATHWQHLCEHLIGELDAPRDRRRTPTARRVVAIDRDAAE